MSDLVDSFVFYRSYYEAIQKIPQKNRIVMYQKIMEYAFNNSIVECDDSLVDLVWGLVEPTLEASIMNRINGKKGGRPRKTPIKNPPIKPPLETNEDVNGDVNEDSNDNEDANMYREFSHLKLSVQEQEIEVPKVSPSKKYFTVTQVKELPAQKWKDLSSGLSDEFREAVCDYQNDRIDDKQRVSENAVKNMLGTLFGFGYDEDMMIACINRSLERGRKGVFAYKEDEARKIFKHQPLKKFIEYARVIQDLDRSEVQEEYNKREKQYGKYFWEIARSEYSDYIAEHGFIN